MVAQHQTILGLYSDRLKRDTGRHDLRSLMMLLFLPSAQRSAVPPSANRAPVQFAFGEAFPDRRFALNAALIGALNSQLAPVLAADKPEYPNKDEDVSNLRREDVDSYMIGKLGKDLEAKKIEKKILSVPLCIALTNADGSPYWNKDFLGSKTAYFFLDPDEAAAEYNRLKRDNPEISVKIVPINEVYRKYIRGRKDTLGGTLLLKPSRKNIVYANRFGASVSNDNKVLRLVGGDRKALEEDSGIVPIFSTQEFSVKQGDDEVYPFFLNYQDYESFVAKAELKQLPKVQITSLDLLMDDLPQMLSANIRLVPEQAFKRRVQDAFGSAFAEGRLEVLKEISESTST